MTSQMINNCLSILSTSSTSNYNVAAALLVGGAGILGYKYLVPKCIKRGLNASYRYTRNLTTSGFYGLRNIYRRQYECHYHQNHSHSCIRNASRWIRMWMWIFLTTYMCSLMAIPSGMKWVWNYTFPDNCKALIVTESCPVHVSVNVKCGPDTPDIPIATESPDGSSYSPVSPVNTATSPVAVAYSPVSPVSPVGTATSPEAVAYSPVDAPMSPMSPVAVAYSPVNAPASPVSPMSPVAVAYSPVDAPASPVYASYTDGDSAPVSPVNVPTSPVNTSYTSENSPVDAPPSPTSPVDTSYTKEDSAPNVPASLVDVPTSPTSPVDTSDSTLNAPSSPTVNPTSPTTDATPSEIVHVRHRHAQDSDSDDDSTGRHKHHRRHLGY